MPPALLSNASRPHSNYEEMSIAELKRFSDRGGAETVVREYRDKRSWDYVWRTGLAGGLAGCAVSISSSTQPTITVLIGLFAGEKCCRAARQGQDPVPSLESAVRKVHGLLVWRRCGHARHLSRRRTERAFPRPFCHSPAYISLRSHQVSRLRADSCGFHSVAR